VSQRRADAGALLAFLASAECDAAKRRHGMEPTRDGLNDRVSGCGAPRTLCRRRAPCQQPAARPPLEQLDAQLAFELVDGARYRRLRTKQRGTGPIRADLVGDGEECAQVAQLGLHRRRNGANAAVYAAAPRIVLVR